MSLHDQVQQLIQEKIDRLATNDRVEELCIATALAIAVGDLETVNYIGDNYAHMFNEEQQAAFDSIRSRTPELKAQAAIEEMSDNPLTQHLQELNQTLQ